MSHSIRTSLLQDPGIHLMVGFNGTTAQTELRSIIRDFRIGGIVLFRRNIESPTQVRELVAEAQDLARSTLGRPLLVSIDQEGGPVQRLIPPFTQLPSARELAHQGVEAVANRAAIAAREMKEIGVHINFAPVLDLVGESESRFMTERSLGNDPEKVSLLGTKWVEALQMHGISATGKHFPGLGGAESDPHHFAPTIHWKSFEEMARHLTPFRRAVQAGVHGLMTSHAKYPLLDAQWPATLSPRINRELLRQAMSFEGLLFSDDMDMAAVHASYSPGEMVRQGFSASIDIFLSCQHTENIGPLHEALARELQSPAMQPLRRESIDRLERAISNHI